MSITSSKHGLVRMKQRGIDPDFVGLLEALLPAVYANKSLQVFLTRKEAIKYAKFLRKMANKFEKNSGTRLILDESGNLLITVYKQR